MVVRLMLGRQSRDLVARPRCFADVICCWIISFYFFLSNMIHGMYTHVQVANKDLVAVDEQVQLKALKSFYER